MKTVPSTHAHRASLAGLAAVALGVVLLVGLAAPATAQVQGKAKIEFAFVAGATAFPAGAYEFEAGGGKVILRSNDPKGASAVLMVLTRLGRHDTDQGTELVFDKVSDKMVLSEIWIDGQDGYLVLNTPAEHGHRVVGGSNPHK
jgi:hypothetical protein